MKGAPKRLALAATTLATIAVAGCSNLQDEHYNWGQEQSCEVAPHLAPAPVRGPEVQPMRRMNLSADALFLFDRSGFGDILPQGRSELDALAQALLSKGPWVQSLEITGYADRLGDESYNSRLALKRAQTVGDYLKNAGVRAPIKALSMGEKQPVTNNCRGTARTRYLIGCLQPNRRVVVEVQAQAQAQAQQD
ncbi:OmpA family protein [Pseudomonas sp. OV226]|uniref:OmpA family protein n=1 Tax=Pseudomonas sp. OV226 TaxID=2135588 RepID=UPI000D6B00F5|nr:OmpA family protein [Pseudomonas sp. OV226]PWK45990.1 outer membrane protein OmpA-like peptidoglycan-associated protein [Pseudomonas sp. OV226]